MVLIQQGKELAERGKAGDRTERGSLVVDCEMAGTIVN